MSPIELALTTLAEVTTTELHRTNDSKGMEKLKIDAHDGGEIAGETRQKIEKKIGRSIVTSENAVDMKTRNRLK